MAKGEFNPIHISWYNKTYKASAWVSENSADFGKILIFTRANALYESMKQSNNSKGIR